MVYISCLFVCPKKEVIFLNLILLIKSFIEKIYLDIYNSIKTKMNNFKT